MRDDEVLLMTFMREELGGGVRAIRCLVLAALAEDSAGGLATIDVEPERLPSMGREVADAAVRRSLHRVFRLGLNGIQVVSKP
ncbi:hypothetical protein [Nocardioides jejuensis]|uniref:hypothetical protein n=1 Tax=Nocardioides jejuensis TaxID=2502782 RepID=UPI001A9F5AC3|nr:hypothetical protein [Nocardioides jejuensis]